MWECPDFYQIGDKYVLMVSPMGAGERTVVYMVGDFDYETGKFSYQINGEIDWGYDYYAPQSFVAPDGRDLLWHGQTVGTGCRLEGLGQRIRKDGAAF